VLVLLEVVGWAEVGASDRLGVALNRFDCLVAVSGNFSGLQVVVGMLQLARRGGCDSRGECGVGDEEFVPDVHCNLRGKAGQILENSCKSWPGWELGDGVWRLPGGVRRIEHGREGKGSAAWLE
jgi:hypothetical protein